MLLTIMIACNHACITIQKLTFKHIRHRDRWIHCNGLPSGGKAVQHINLDEIDVLITT